jgi:hypothetical protein
MAIEGRSHKANLRPDKLTTGNQKPGLVKQGPFGEDIVMEVDLVGRNGNS